MRKITAAALRVAQSIVVVTCCFFFHPHGCLYLVNHLTGHVCRWEMHCCRVEEELSKFSNGNDPLIDALGNGSQLSSPAHNESYLLSCSDNLGPLTSSPMSNKLHHSSWVSRAGHVRSCCCCHWPIVASKRKGILDCASRMRRKYEVLLMLIVSQHVIIITCKFCVPKLHHGREAHGEKNNIANQDWHLGAIRSNKVGVDVNFIFYYYYYCFRIYLVSRKSTWSLRRSLRNDGKPLILSGEKLTTSAWSSSGRWNSSIGRSEWMGSRYHCRYHFIYGHLNGCRREM